MSVEALTVEGWKLVIATATGPSTTVSVTAGSSADVDLTISSNPAIVREILGIRTISGLPSGIVISGITYPDSGTIRIRVFNATGESINVTANSVTASALCKGY